VSPFTSCDLQSVPLFDKQCQRIVDGLVNKGTTMKTNRSEILTEILEKTGGIRRLSAKLNISFQAVAKWWRVPVNHVQKISVITGIPAEKIRPDIYERPDS